MIEIASYSYTHNDGDQIWDDDTRFFKNDDGTFSKCYCDGYYEKETSVSISYDEIVADMEKVRKEVKQRHEDIALYGAHNPRTRSGYKIWMDLISDN